ncbi:hypothetical protein [Bradyrhizobium zhanjiangense]|uniref:hypothetical protein n=1 Tax=Bradyrhizobium zhanjiangense TaxID=1325107 RepID=UPI001008AFD3|nr:hypothetical protein [Bradyrhizobium zhanjiangense]
MVEGAHDRVSVKPKSIWLLPSFYAALNCRRARLWDPGSARALGMIWVILFFCLLHVFDAPLDRVHTIWQRADFLAYLLGVDTWI